MASQNFLEQINLYWDDLSEQGQESLIENGFDPDKFDSLDEKPIGELFFERNSNGLKKAS